MPPPDVIWDIGANIGSFSCVAGKAFPSARILAFEPDESALKAMKKNLDANGVRNVTIVPHPVTKDGRNVEFVGTGASGSANIYGTGAGLTLKSRVPTVPDISQVQRLFIKLDCEGAEGEIAEWVCDHLGELPRKLRLVAECHPWCPVPVETTKDRLMAAGLTAQIAVRFGEVYLEAERNWH